MREFGSELGGVRRGAVMVFVNRMDETGFRTDAILESGFWGEELERERNGFG